MGEATETAREEGVSIASYRWDTTVFMDGRYALRAVVTDFVGSGESTAPWTLYVNNDPTVPVPGNLQAVRQPTADPRYYDIALSWETVPAADVAGHEVYWSYDDQWRQLATVSGGERTYTHRVRPGETGYSYRFRVRAFDYAGARGEFSGEVAVVIPPPPGGDVQRPEVVSISPDDGSAIGPGLLPFNIRVSDDGEIKAVYLQYSTDGVNWMPISSPETYIDPPSGTGFWSAVRSWTRDKTLPSGQYYVRAAAEDAGGNIGYLTHRYEIFDLSPPRAVQYEPQPDGSLKISWLRSDWLVDQTSCEIYRAVAGEGTYEKIATKSHLSTWPPLPDDQERAANQYLDTGLDKTKRYYYQLREVTLNPYRYSRFTATYAYQAFDQSPPTVRVEPDEDETNGLAVIRWEHVHGADFYRVFRAESPEAEPAQIAEVSQPGPDGKWSYRDTGLDQKKWYYYRVQACTTSPPLSGPLSAAVGVKPSVRPPVLTVDKDLWEIGGTKATLTGTARDPVGVAGVRASCVIDGVAYHYYGEVSGENWSVQVDLKTKRELDFSVSATDTDGHETWPPLTVKVRSLDWTPPRISIAGLAEGQATNAVPGFMVAFADEGLGLDLDSISITIDDQPVPRTHSDGDKFSFRTRCAVPASGYLAKGSHTLRITVRDLAGYETELLRHFTVDYPPLAVGQLDWTQGVTTPDRQLACSPESVLRLFFNDGSGTGVTFDIQIKDLLEPSRQVLFETRTQSGLIEIVPAEPLPYGPYELSGELRNGIGESVQFTKSFLCYTDPPLVEISQPRDGEELAFGTYFTGRVADRSRRGLQSWEATLNGDPLTGISLDQDGRFRLPQKLMHGEHTFGLKAVENASGRTSSLQVAVKAKGRKAPSGYNGRGWVDTGEGGWTWSYKLNQFDRDYFEGESVPLVISPLVTNQTNGGSGYSTYVRLVLENPESGAREEREVFLKNFTHERSPAFSWGSGYPTHSLTMVPKSLFSSSGELKVTMYRKPEYQDRDGYRPHVCVNNPFQQSWIGYPPPYIHGGEENWTTEPAFMRPYYGQTVEENPVVLLAYITDDTGTGIGEVRLEVDGVLYPVSRSSKAGDVEISCAVNLPKGEHTAKLTAVNGLGIRATATTVFNAGVGSSVSWMEVQRGTDTYRVSLNFSRDLSEEEKAAIKGRYITSTVLSGATLKQVSVFRVTDNRVELVTDPSLAKEILLAAMRGAYYRDHVPGSQAQVNQALVDWVNYWKNNWGYGLLAGLCPDRPQPPTKLDVHKAVIASALAGGDSPTLLSDELDSALSFYSKALGGAKTVADVREKLTDWKVLAQSSSRAASVCGKVVKGLSYVDEATQLTKEMMETIFLAYWQAAAVAEYRDNLLRIQPYVTDGTLRTAINSLVDFDPQAAYDLIDRKIGEYFAKKVEEEVRDYLKDVLFKINPILGAATMGLDIGYFIAEFTGWEEAYVCNHQASHEAAAEGGARPAARHFGAVASPEPGKVDFRKVTDAAVAAKLNLFAASRFYGSVATLSSLFKNYPSLGQHAQYEATYRQESAALLAEAKAAVPGLASSSRDYFALAGKLTKQNLAVGTLVVNAYSPVTVVVTDPLGRRAGCDQYGNLLSEMPGATYNGPEAEPQEIRITNPLPGQYQVDVYSTVREGEAPYKIVVATTEADGTVISEVYREGTAVAGGMETIALTSNEYGNLTQGETPFTLSNLACSPDTVTAGAAPGSTTPARLEFEITREALVWVDVEDLSGGAIASLVAGEPRTAGKVTVYWNGRDALERLVADGTYRFAVRAEDREGATLSGQAQVKVNVPPMVSGGDPAAGAAGIPVEKTVTVRFNEEVREGPNYGGMAIKDQHGNAVPFTASLSGSTLTLQPLTRLSYGTAYTVTVPDGAVQDMAGNVLAQAYTLTFTTRTAPASSDTSASGTTPPEAPESVPPQPAPPAFYGY
ncbi:MAG: Ig-like domain-containing protein [Firmicutes bacterium]|nr:Ig-like domain-containing protein [Bacillota bacterium]